MRWLLNRVQLDPDVTIGELFIERGFECYTLEDPVRPDGVKIFGETAIPAGTYRIDITYSPRFKRDLPLLLNVTGFVGIRIHPGDTTGDTEGCILVGTDRLAKSIGRSRLAFDALYEKLAHAKANHEQIVLEIVS